MRVFNLSPIRWITVVFAILMLLPLVVAVLVPVLAPIPAASAGWSAAPLPDRDEPLPGFEDLLEPLPLIARDLPDQRSQIVTETYDSALYFDATDSDALLQASLEALNLPSSLEMDLKRWMDSADSSPLPMSIFDRLSSDPLNAERLSNLAVAMFYNQIVIDPHNFMGVGEYSNKPSRLTLVAIEINPNSRIAHINNFYFRAHVEPLSNMEYDLIQWMRQNPGDITVLRFAVEKSIGFSQSTPAYAWFSNEFLEVILPEYAQELLSTGNPQEMAFANAMLGDLQLGALDHNEPMGNTRLANAPFEVRSSARSALNYYDRALMYSDDPSIYMARAFTLSLLGEHESAIYTLEHAIAIHPEQDFLNDLLPSLYLARRGSPEIIRESMERARDIERRHDYLYSDTQPHALAQTRVVANHVSASPQVANVPQWDVDYQGFKGGGGGYSVAFDELTVDLKPPAGVISLSEALGDPQGVMADAKRLNLGSLDQSVDIAQLVADPDQASPDLLQDIDVVRTASTWLMFSGRPEQATNLCESALRIITDEWDSRVLRGCISSSLILRQEYEAALSYTESNSFFAKGLLWEIMGKNDKARTSYQSGLESEPANQHSNQLRLAGVILDDGDFRGAIEMYDEWLIWAEPEGCVTGRCISCDLDNCVEITHLVPHAFSNRGIARLQLTGDSEESANCSGQNAQVCLDSIQDFDAALQFDALNPVFIMNRAWVARLMGDQELANELMMLAVESDHTLYPVLNDLGVANAPTDPEAAHQYFSNAVAANPEYALGWWNLGVLEMQKGPGGILRGQAYLARAFALDKSLVTEPLKFKTDESIYRVEITGDGNNGAAWTFGTASSLAATTFGLFGFVLVIIGTTKEVFKDKVIAMLMDRTETTRSWAKRNLLPSYNRFRSQPWSTSVLFIATIAVMLFATALPAWRGERDAALSSAILAIFALATAVTTHEFAHRLSAHLMKAELEPVQWTPGIGVSLLLLPINLSSGPFPAQSVKTKDDTDRLWIYLFGPLANLLVFFAVLVIYLIQPLPALRMIAIAQLSVMSYSVLPFEPLDGHPLQDAQPKLVAGLSFLALCFGVLFALGRL